MVSQTERGRGSRRIAGAVAPTLALGLAATLLAASVLAPSAPVRSQVASLEDFAGTYRFSNSASERRGLEQAIDHVADQLNLFIREIARGEMRRRVQPEPSIVIDVVDETHVGLGIGDWGPVRVVLNSPGRRVRGRNGDEHRMSIHLRRGQLIHREQQDQGFRVNVLRLSPDLSRLLMSARIGSDQLPDDIRYRLSFRRVR